MTNYNDEFTDWIGFLRNSFIATWVLRPVESNFLEETTLHHVRFLLSAHV